MDITKQQTADIVKEMLGETGVDPSKKLAAALTAHAAAVTDPVAKVDLDAVVVDIAPDAVAALIVDETERRVLTANVMGTSAYAEVREALDRRVAREYLPMTPRLFERYGEMFDETVATFEAAAAVLGRNMPIDQATGRGADHIIAWTTAREAVATLGRFAIRHEQLLARQARILDPAHRRVAFVDADTADLLDLVPMNTNLFHTGDPTVPWCDALDVIVTTAGLRLRWGSEATMGDTLTRHAAQQAEHDAALAAKARAEGDAEVEAWTSGRILPVRT